MRSIKALVLFLTLAAIPLSAQLTPAQRQEREAREFAQNYAHQRTALLEERALNGDASAYGGPSACQGTSYPWAANCRGYFGYRPWRVNSSYVGPWITVADVPRGARSLVRGEGARVKAKAEQASVLTLASPVGEVGRTLELRTTIAGDAASPSWESTQRLTGDDQERYLVQLPPFAAGTYRLKVEVFDPATPDAPVTSSTSTLTVE